MDRKPTPTLAQIAAALGSKEATAAGVIGALVSAQIDAETRRVQKFEDLLDLEFEARTTRLAVKCAEEDTTERQIEVLKHERDAAQLALSEAVGDLSTQEMAAYGPYRLRVIAECNWK